MSGERATIGGRTDTVRAARRGSRAAVVDLRTRRRRGPAQRGPAVRHSAAGRPAGRRSWPTLVAGFVVATFVLAVAVAALAAVSIGVRWFDVRTPSMGTAAPVGTLVVTRPVAVDQLRIGDVISFRPPIGRAETYTHRVVALPADGTVVTRGDINGARDPWSLRQADVVGRAVVLLPGLGWALRALPFLAIGFAAVWVGSTLFRRPDHRAAARVLGGSLVVAVTAAVLKPLVGTTLITTTTDTPHPVAVVVSTGLLPSRVSVVGGASAHLHPGEVARLPVDAAGAHHLATAIDLTPAGWAIGLAIAALPLLWCLVIGLPRPAGRRAGGRAHGRRAAAPSGGVA